MASATKRLNPKQEQQQGWPKILNMARNIVKTWKIMKSRFKHLC